MRRERIISPETVNNEEESTFLSLRPTVLDEYIGQQELVGKLRLSIEASRRRGEPHEHILFYGPPGLGKTTLAHILAHEMKANIVSTSVPTLTRSGDLMGILTNLQNGDVLFIDEIHRLPAQVEEYLYPAMEDFRLDIVIDQGPSARSVRLNLPRFTLIGATTRSGLLTAPLRSRFEITDRLDYYVAADLQQICQRSARILSVEVDDLGALEIARRSRGTPRLCNNLLRRVRDYAQVRADGRITAPVADKALAMLDIDEHGLDDMDKRILEAVVHKHGGGPVGVNTIAVAVGEEPGTLEEVYEPFLIQEGYLQRTPQGRVATELAYKKLGVKRTPRGQKELF